VVAYDPSAWSELFVASAGAAAALAGLVFVAVSINIDRILQFEGLTERALETVVMLLSVVLVSMICLIPGQSNVALGAELLGLGLIVTAIVTTVAGKVRRHHAEPRLSPLARAVVRFAATVPLVIGGASVIAESGGGLYWTAAALIFAIGGAVANAWVFLVEILR
jgi:modulator of FtsH protease